VNKLYSIEGRVNKVLEGMVTVLFFIILSLTIVLVIMRYGLNSTIVGGSEAMNYLFIYTTALGVSISIGKNSHIKISYFIDKLAGKLRTSVNILNFTLIGFINAVMTWYSIPWILSTGYFESPVLRIPNWMVYGSVPLGCSLVILYCINHMIMECIELFSKGAAR
jgi:TRAP-type C4-dicarboxylate transport system permease small subunit